MERRSSVIGGMILILVGALFLLLQIFPGLADRVDMARQWPLIIVTVGAVFLLAALLGAPPLVIPGSIIAGIGGLLYYQNLTGNWASWAFAWTLIPGFAGVGTVLMGLLDRKSRQSVGEGLRMMAISAILFVVFGSFFGGLGVIGDYWPVVLILFGAWLLVKNFKRS